MKNIKGKLVRDNIPTIIRQNNRKPITKILPKEKLQKALLEKFVEELSEFKQAKLKEKGEELADLLQIILSLGKTIGLSEKRLMQICKQKRNERGAFEKRYLYFGDAKNN